MRHQGLGRGEIRIFIVTFRPVCHYINLSTLSLELCSFFIDVCRREVVTIHNGVKSSRLRGKFEVHFQYHLKKYVKETVCIAFRFVMHFFRR